MGAIKIKILDFIGRRHTVAIKTKLTKEEVIEILEKAKETFNVEIDYFYSDAFWGYGGNIKTSSMQYHPAIIDLTVTKFETKTSKNNFIKYIKKELSGNVGERA